MPPPQVFGTALEQSIASAISKAGGKVTIPSSAGKQRTPDLLMWLPQVDRYLFNPAAIEAVESARAPNLPKMQRRFADFLWSTGLHCGLIIVNSVSLEKQIRSLRPIPYIFSLTLHEFRQKLESSELAAWVKRERNRFAHGVR